MSYFPDEPLYRSKDFRVSSIMKFSLIGPTLHRKRVAKKEKERLQGRILSKLLLSTFTMVREEPASIKSYTKVKTVFGV